MRGSIEASLCNTVSLAAKISISQWRVSAGDGVCVCQDEECGAGSNTLTELTAAGGTLWGAMPRSGMAHVMNRDALDDMAR